MTQLEKSVFGAGFVAMTEDELYEVNGGGGRENLPQLAGDGGGSMNGGGEGVPNPGNWGRREHGGI